jgi:hypothetical protein
MKDGEASGCCVTSVETGGRGEEGEDGLEPPVVSESSSPLEFKELCGAAMCTGTWGTGGVAGGTEVDSDKLSTS